MKLSDVELFNQGFKYLGSLWICIDRNLDNKCTIENVLRGDVFQDVPGETQIEPVRTILS